MKTSKWMKYHEQPVAVQLEDEYCGVTGINQFAIQSDERGNPAGILSVPLLRGMASVEVEEDGTLMTIRSPDPNPELAHTGRHINISFDPNKMVKFISKGEEAARILAPE